MPNNKRVRLTTPKGTAKFPKLTEPDTRFNPNGDYSVGLIFAPGEADEFLAQLDKLADASFEKAKQDLLDKGKKAQAKRVVRAEPYKMEIDQEGEETGNFEVKFKMKAKVETKAGKVYEFQPQLFDAKGKAIEPDSIEIWGGSILRVNYTPSDYYMPATKNAGISLQLNAVQVLELVSRGGGSAESFGFDAEDDGFDYDNSSSNEDDDTQRDSLAEAEAPPEDDF